MRALELWLFCLGAEAGNLALKTLSRGGVYLGGGVVPNLLPAFAWTHFFAGFDHKGRMSAIVKEVPIYAITEPLAALYGAALAG